MAVWAEDDDILSGVAPIGVAKSMPMTLAKPTALLTLIVRYVSSLSLLYGGSCGSTVVLTDGTVGYLTVCTTFERYWSVAPFFSTCASVYHALTVTEICMGYNT